MSRAVLIAALLFCLLPLRASADTAQDPAELARTWQRAWVYVPRTPGKARKIPARALPAYVRQHPDAKFILYLHGCSGIIHSDRTIGRFYARSGYIFIAPDSFARKIKPISCVPLLHQGGLHKNVIEWRQAEAGYALARLRALPGMAQAPIALVGHSEGAITAATFKGAPVSARIIESWTCHAGWPRYHGLNAPKAEPVLSLLAHDDPWFTHPSVKGDCSPFMDSNDRSYVFKKPDRLHDEHALSKDRRVRRIILDFLSRAM